MANFFFGFGAGGGSAGGGGGSNPNIQIPGLQAATDQLTQLNAAVGGLNASLQALAQQQQKLGSQIGSMFSQIGSQANNAANQVNQVNNAVNQVQSTVQSTQSGGGIVSKLFGVASAAAGSDILKDLAMFPLRFISQTLGSNRQLSMNMQSTLAGQMYATNSTIYGPTGIANKMARFPGDILGTPEDIMNLMGAARSAGAFMDLNQATQPSARTTGFLHAVRQMQMITPATPVGNLAGAVASQLNPQLQQQSVATTGGAFSMIGRGGKVKSLQEWAEGILRWVEGMRPPPDTGKPFDYGQLLAQYFPGSNIDAWLTQQGVTGDMKEYWWDYSLGKANRTHSTQGIFAISPINQSAQRGGNQPWERLQAVSAKGRGELQLAGQMAGTYANKEQSNRWFNDLLAQIQSDVIPKQTSRGALSAMQYLPDTLEELLMGLLERGGSMGALIGGGIGYGIHGAQSLAKNLIGGLAEGQNFLTEGGLMDLLQQFSGGGGVLGAIQSLPAQIAALVGDEPDIGDSGGMEWGMHGTASTAGLHPDMKRKVGDMMRANPRLRVNSGLRDTVTQQNLKARGYNRVSGKPSAHTRGLAADMGPSSEYGWLMKNAGKFGLRSGKSFGEPWHVGLGDAPGIGDINGSGPPTAPPPNGETIWHDTSNGGLTWQWDEAAQRWNIYTGVGGTTTPQGGPPGPITPIAPTGPANVYIPPNVATAVDSHATDTPGLGRLFNLFTGGFNRDTAITAIGGLVPAVMTLFMGAFGMSKDDADTSSLNFDPGLYNALIQAAGTFRFGGLQSQGGAAGFDYAKSFGGLGGGGAGGGKITDSNSSGAKDLAGALTALGKNPAGMSSGVMVANLAHLAGFSNDGVAKVVAISQRESKWDPSAHNTNANTGDNSYGLMQINMLGEMGPKRAAQFGISDYDELLDPYTNLKAAFSMSGGTNFDPWVGYRKGISFEESTDLPGARRIAREAGFGDMPESMAQDSYAQFMVGDGAPRSSGSQIFHNQFVINATGGTGSSGGIDVRRAVGQIADQLEAEMNKRTVRSN